MSDEMVPVVEGWKVIRGADGYEIRIRSFMTILRTHGGRPDWVNLGDERGWFRPNWRRRTRKNPSRTTWGHQRA